MDNLENTNGIDEQTEKKDAAKHPRTALDFEITDEDGGLIFDSEADITPEVAKESAPAEQNDEDGVKEEFSIPENFEVNEKYTSQSFMEDPIRIRTTYVPRFTEVSENYRMADDPRPRTIPRKQASKVEEKKEEPSGPLDPTSEIHETKEVEKVIVTSAHSGIEEPTDESITLFKFNTPVPEKSPATEDAAAQVRDAANVAIDDEPTEEIEESLPEEEPAKQSKGEYVMPDPVDNVRIIDYSASKEVVDYDAPAGASAGFRNTGKAEFTTPNQKEYFKDKFLDTIMSVKVRIIAVVLILSAMVVMEVAGFFGMNIYKNFGLSVVPSAKAVIDFQFATCLLLFAIPELVRLVRGLVKKTVLPELAIPVSYLVLGIYTLVICLIDAIDYPAFSLLFGVQVLCAIFGTYFKQSADYITFRLISKGGVKNVIDKKLTRELPRENMALDGAIDEYRSSTARMFRTNFVSNFFARTQTVNENGFNVILILCIGFGVALVSGLISFFVSGNSVVALVENATLVFLLSCPCCAVIARKMIYKHSNREAEAENSTFVGETSFLDYSEVDVIAYEDTEIFGTEDVSIKKVHLYGKAFNTPKAMKQMYALFAVVGGPLDHVFSSSLDRKGDVATDVVIEEDGIRGCVDGHVVCAGTEEFMLRNNIAIPSDDYRTKLSSTDSTKVMYGAEDRIMITTVHFVEDVAEYDAQGLDIKVKLNPDYVPVEGMESEFDALPEDSTKDENKDD